MKLFTALSVAYILILTCSWGNINVSAITPPDTSLDTIPLCYIGGVNCKERSQENIEMLAKLRFIVIEKWEGPCWYDCYDNLTKVPPLPCQPSCGAENYQLKTLKQAKALNPKLSAVFYLNSLYDFAMLELHEKYVKANADIVDVNGKVIAIKNDNGMPNINLFDFSQKVGRDLWTGFVQNLKDTGYIDGVFDDKAPVFAMWNKTGKFWQICEWANLGGRGKWNISCGVISNETAMKYNAGKLEVLGFLYETFAPNGVVFFNTTQKVKLLADTETPLQFAENVQNALSKHKYAFVHREGGDLIDGDCTSTKSNCTEDQIAMFLLGVEKGAFLACNGWDEQFSKPLGDPSGPAVAKGNTVERHFKSGTYVTWDLTTKTGKIFWASDKLERSD